MTQEDTPTNLEAAPVPCKRCGGHEVVPHATLVMSVFFDLQIQFVNIPCPACQGTGRAAPESQP